VALAFDDVGRASAVPIVLLPAFGVPRAMWREQQAALAVEFRVLAFDVPGLSGEPGEQPFTMVRAAQSIAHAVSERVGRRAHLAGISLGGTLAVQVALDFPEHVASLMVSGGQARPGILSRLERRVAQVAPERFLVGGFPPGLRDRYPELVLAAAEQQKRVGKHHLVAALAEYSRVDLRSRLGEIDVPALIVCGTKNRVSLRGSRALATGIPGARFEAVPGAGHVWNLEVPEVFTLMLGDFVHSAEPA
jgi:3-oxoadipate enol-lactonase